MAAQMQPWSERVTRLIYWLSLISSFQLSPNKGVDNNLPSASRRSFACKVSLQQSIVWSPRVASFHSTRLVSFNKKVNAACHLRLESSLNQRQGQRSSACVPRSCLVWFGFSFGAEFESSNSKRTAQLRRLDPIELVAPIFKSGARSKFGASNHLLLF